MPQAFLNEDSPSRQVMRDRSHIPNFSFWLTIFRIFQLLLALIIMILTTFAATVFGTYFFPGYGMSWFSFAWSILFSVYVVVIPRCLTRLYNYWIHIALESSLIVFYLTTFSLLASELPLWNASEGYNGHDSFDGIIVSAARASDAAVAFSLILCLSFISSLGYVGYTIHLHRTASTSSSFHTRQIHHFRALQQPASLHHSGTPPSIASQTISSPIMLSPAVELYNTKGMFERDASTQSWSRDRRLEEMRLNDDRRTDFSPAFL